MVIQYYMLIMKTIKAEEVKSGDFLLDVRTRGEFATEHIEGSECDPLQELNAGTWAAKLDGNRRCVVVCQGGIRAKQAAEKLEAAGVGNLVVLEGGVNAWKAAGKPCLRGERCVLPLDRQMRIVMGALVLMGVILGATLNPIWYALAGFVGVGMIFAGITDICPLAMVVARMPWNNTGAPCCKGSGKQTVCCGGSHK